MVDVTVKTMDSQSRKFTLVKDVSEHVCFILLKFLLVFCLLIQRHADC